MNRLFPLLLLALAGSLSFRAATPEVAGFTFVKSLGGIAEYQLSANNLGVLLLEDHSTPVVNFMVTYRVGSRNEVTGTTGATHLLEHLMFKGSREFHRENGKGFDTMLDRVGGINNATTWLDRTNYFEVFPSDHLELAVQLEADRMRHLLLRESDRQPEMTVVRNEFEREENNPGAALDKEVYAAAFLAHPYHHPTIGWRSDIEKVSIEKLREFYDTFYWPNNATITVIGDFQPDQTLQLIGRYFGGISRSPRLIPVVYTEEPPQTGPRRVVLKRPGEVGVVQIAYKAPAARHADHPALEVLAAVLSEGKTSRLYRALIDTGLAIEADATKGYFHDEALFQTVATLAPGTTHEQAEKVLVAEVERVRQDGITPAELERAVNQLLASIAFRRDGVAAIAGEINEAIAVGDWTCYLTLPEKLAAVTVADVQRVAKTYCDTDQSTTGWFIPLAESSGSASVPPAQPKPRASTPALLFGSPHYYRDPTDRASSLPSEPRAVPTGTSAASDSKIAAYARRRPVAGFDVVTLKTAIKDVVTIRGALGAGDVFNPPENSAIADLTAGLLDKGTRDRDQFALAGMLEQAGATIGFNASSHTVNFAAKCLRRDLPLVLSLLAEQLRAPRFDPAEFAKLKQQIAGRYQQQREDPDFRAHSMFARAIFPAGHPNCPPTDEKYLADLEAATLDQVKAFHAACYGTASARLVAVGDIDDVVIDRAIAEHFANWKVGRAMPVSAPAPALTSARAETLNLPGKSSVSVVLGQPSRLRYGDSDYQALNLATAVLGSGFFSARLLDIVRTREGLTYNITAGLGADTYTDGAWAVQAGFAPELLEQGTAATLRELRRFHADGVTAEELAMFKITLTGSYKVTLSTTEELAGALLTALQRGRGPEWIDEYPRQLQALTLDDVNAAIRRHLDPDRMVMVSAGTLPAPAASK